MRKRASGYTRGGIYNRRMLPFNKGALVHSSMFSGHAVRMLESDLVARPLRHTRRHSLADGPLLYIQRIRCICAVCTLQCIFAIAPSARTTYGGISQHPPNDGVSSICVSYSVQVMIAHAARHTHTHSLHSWLGSTTQPARMALRNSIALHAKWGSDTFLSD